MASKTRGVWAIDVGSSSLKALRLAEGEDGMEVLGFDYVEHSRVLSSGELDISDKEEILAQTFKEFLSRHDLSNEEVAISIAGHNSFARFIKLPPVEKKKIPEIVQFEAVQQIPFDINEVEWDWQLMGSEDSPDKEVGLFAIKNELIAEVMDHFTAENLRVTCVQISPMALNNYLQYDRDDVVDRSGKATIILDVGTENTTLVICTKDSVWQRSIRIGGNTFTEAIEDAFRINFDKAEKLKRKAPVSKYMRQIYTAMKPVYTDFGSEVQRSLGFYGSSGAGRDKGFSKVIALGGGMKLQGLAKYLQQTLGIPVIKPDSFEKLKMGEDVSSAKFHENVSDFGTVYGLGAQLLGQAVIKVNMLPRKIARAMAWTRKAHMFTVAACILLAAVLFSLVYAFQTKQSYGRNESTRRQINSVINEVRGVQSEVDTLAAKQQPNEDIINKQMDLFKSRDIVPMFNETIVKCLPNKENTSDQAALYDAFAAGDVEALMEVPRAGRKQMFITRLEIEYASDVTEAPFIQSTGKSRSRRSSSRGKKSTKRLPPELMSDFDLEYSRKSTAATDAQEEQTTGGFVVLIEGYSPYGKVENLIDPPGVGDDISRWGVVTRFENLKKLFPDCPFELYGKGDITHFVVEQGLVEVGSAEMPEPIGTLKEVQRVPAELLAKQARRSRGRDAYGLEMMGGGTRLSSAKDRVTTENVLVDPMTGEEISRTYNLYTRKEIDTDPELTLQDLGRKKLDNFGQEQFIERDRWFRIHAKFIWEDAPKPPASESTDAYELF